MKIDSRRQFPVYEVIVGIGIDVGPGQGGNNADNERDRQLPDFFDKFFHLCTFVINNIHSGRYVYITIEGICKRIRRKSRKIFLHMKLLLTGFPQQQRYGIFLQRIFLMRFSVPFLTGFSDNKTPLCGISPYVFSFFFLRGSLSFRRWFSHPFISRISCFPLWDFSRPSFTFFPVLFSSGFLHPSPRGFSVFPRGVSVRYATKKTPGVVREFFLRR